MRRTSGALLQAVRIAAVLYPLITFAADWCGRPGRLAPGEYENLPADEGSLELSGAVVSSVDGTPVRAALVQLLGEKPRAMLTGADGSFHFEGLSAGDAIIVARKPGYFSVQEYYPESAGEQHVLLGTNVAPVRLKLYPEAVVYGRVTNDNGRPLEGFTVQLRRAGGKHAGGSHGELPSTTTNENGEYRLAELREGTYLVSVSRKLDADTILPLFEVEKFRRGYPTYFYPSVTDASLATPVRITPGKRVQADMRLASQALYQIRGEVQGVGGEGPVVVVLVGRHDTNPVAAATVTPGTAGFTLEGVPAGSYYLGALLVGSEGENTEKMGIAGVEVTQNLEGVSLALSGKKRMRVRFRYEYNQSAANAADAPGISVSLLHTDLPMETDLFAATLTPMTGSPEEGSDVWLAPGSYSARVNGQPNRCVASVKVGDTEALAEDLHVSEGESNDLIEVVVRDDCGRVQGVVSKDGQPAMGRVLVIPEEMPRRGVSVAANSDGGFQIQGLLPGKYLAVALERADDLDVDDAETVGKVKARGMEVEVPASGSTNVMLELKSLEQ